jgi:hypothetical protein
MDVNAQYTLEQAEDDIAVLRGQVDRLSEILTQYDVAAGQVPNSVTLGYVQHSSTGQMKYLSDDGNAYNTGRLTIPCSGQQTINSASFTAVNGLTCSLGALTYRVSGQIAFSPNQSGASAEFQFAGSGGLALTSGRWFFAEYEVLSPITMGNGTLITALSSAFTTTVIGGGLADRIITIDGTIIVSSAGTLTLQAATTVAADTYTIRQNGTYLEISPIS